MVNTIRLWSGNKGERPSVMASSGPCLLSPEGVDASADAARAAGRAPLIFPVPAQRGGIAMLLVPDGLDGRLTRNGHRLAAGAHLIAHADGLAWEGLRVWVAREEAPTEAVYDPEVHGPDVFCARTRSRLRPGEPVVICPGTATTECGVLYRAAAWMNLRCHLCGFNPGGEAWSPPQRENGELDDLLRLAAQPQQ